MRKKILIAGTLALIGCGNRNFNTPQLLKTPRVLAIQAEPPQPRFGTSTTLRALTYQPPVASNAVECAGVDPAARYEWSWCPLPTNSGDSYLCHIQQSDLDGLFAMLGLGPAPLLDLGTNETATLTNPFPAQLLDGLCTGAINPFAQPDAGTKSADSDSGSTSIFSCDKDLSGQPRFGFPITITLKYTPPCGSPPQDNFGPTLTTVFTVLLPRDDTPGNLNPVMGGIQATWAGAPDGGATAVDTQTYDLSPSEIDAGETALDAGELAIDAGDTVDAATPSAPADAASGYVGPLEDKYGVLLDDAFSTLVPRQKRIQLHAQIPIESSETLPPAQADAFYAAAQDPTLTKRLTERLSLRWYTEAGDFGDGGEGGYRTGFLGFPADTNSPFSGATDNKWTPPKSEDYEGGTSRFIVVLSDSRGGVTWTTGSASLEPKP